MNTQPVPPPGPLPGASPDPAPTGPGPTGPGAPRPDRGVTDFFDRLRGLGVVRPDRGRWAAGVCAGLAHRWGLDPLLVRGLFFVASFVTGIGLAVYGLLWLFLPHPDGRIHAQELLSGKVTAGLVGGMILVLSNLPSAFLRLGDHGEIYPFGGGLLTVALVALVIWWLYSRDSARLSGRFPGEVPGGSGTTSTVPPAGPGYPTSGPVLPRLTKTEPVPVFAPPVDLHAPSRPLTRVTLGLTMIIAAVVVLGSQLGNGYSAPAWLVATAVALAVVSLGVIAAGFLGRRSGGLAPVAIVLALVAGNGALWDGSTADFGTERTWVPTSITAPTPDSGSPFIGTYELDAGSATLDLTDPALVTALRAASPSNPPVAKVSLGAGELIIIVPAQIQTTVKADLGIGVFEDDLPGGSESSGPGLSVGTSQTGAGALAISAELGAGQIRVVPQGTQVQR